MSIKKLQKNLLISIDPGFDTVKVTINGHMFKFPFNVEPTDETKFADSMVKENFLVYRDMERRTWRVGDYARSLIFDNKTEDDVEERMKDFYSDDRFLSNEFKIGVKTAIALALVKYEELGGLPPVIPNEDDLEDEIICHEQFFVKNLEEFTVSLIVSLPHDFREKYSAPVVRSLEGVHEFELKIGIDTYKKFKIVLDPDLIFTTSQAMIAIIGETTDDQGYTDDTRFRILIEGPTLVLDGGYYTWGVVPITRGGSVDNDKADSNTSFAMKNVNEQVAEAVKDRRPDIKPYVIEYLCQSNEGELKFINNGKAEKINLNEEKDKQIEKTCDQFIKHINKTFNSLLDFKYVLVAGGTGFRFFEQLKKYYIENEIIDEKNFMLTTNVLYGTEYPVEYAVSVGAYKALIGKLRLLRSTEE